MRWRLWFAQEVEIETSWHNPLNLPSLPSPPITILAIQMTETLTMDPRNSPIKITSTVGVLPKVNISYFQVP